MSITECKIHYKAIDNNLDKITLHIGDTNDIINIKLLVDALLLLMRFDCASLKSRPLLPNILSSFWSSLRIASLSCSDKRNENKEHQVSAHVIFNDF